MVIVKEGIDHGANDVGQILDESGFGAKTNGYGNGDDKLLQKGECFVIIAE